jgi:hypothetical protein
MPFTGMRSDVNLSRMARATSSLAQRAYPQSRMAWTSGGMGISAFLSLIWQSPPAVGAVGQAQLAAGTRKIKP